MRLICRLMAGALMGVCGVACGAATGVAADTAPDAHTLGVTESILSYCARVDTASAAKIKRRLKQMAENASLETLSKLRSSADYRAGYDAVTDFVGKVDPHNATQPCIRAAAAGNK
jgi:hypothetical protein